MSIVLDALTALCDSTSLSPACKQWYPSPLSPLSPQRVGHDRASPRVDGEHSLSARLFAPRLPHQDRSGDGVLHSLRRGTHEWSQPHPLRLAPQAAVRPHAALFGLLQRGQL